MQIVNRLILMIIVVRTENTQNIKFNKSYNHPYIQNISLIELLEFNTESHRAHSTANIQNKSLILKTGLVAYPIIKLGSSEKSTNGPT